ncbi:unnamed protein product [Ambrosiozyma monospora]|uniref:Unnamed protein product n=1 Tax=Ambrosiozyma monospora TaxID=43982 RepID=A0A9W6T056_AMBMO|nr:unnamed protein product [Ambrosiozyma monospora]
MYQYRCQAVCKSVDSVIGLSFNTVGRESSDSMNILSIVSMIFMPLSFWNGYSGNFGIGGSHSSRYYWALAISFDVVFMCLVLWRAFFKQIKQNKRNVEMSIQEWREDRSQRNVPKPHRRNTQLQSRLEGGQHGIGELV